VTAPQLVVHADPQLLAAAVASRLVTTLVDAQAARGSASVALTGGGTGTAMLEQLRTSAACMAIDWSRLDIFWGDERFLPTGHPERNETQARAALLVPCGHRSRAGVRHSRLRRTAGRRSRRRCRRLRPDACRAQPPRRPWCGPRFDVLMLGMGAEGHVASVFPDSPAVYEQERTVVAVRNCPKPPPTRISLTLPAIRQATQVWLCVSGDAKAAAVQLALGGAGEVSVPAAGALGQRRTLWLLDRAAAGSLPRELLPR